MHVRSPCSNSHVMTCSHVLGCVAQVVCWQRPKAKLRLPHRRARREPVEKTGMLLAPSLTPLHSMRTSPALACSYAELACRAVRRSVQSRLPLRRAAGSVRMSTANALWLICSVVVSRSCVSLCACVQWAECAGRSGWHGQTVCGGDVW